jgi:zinc protease
MRRSHLNPLVAAALLSLLSPPFPAAAQRDVPATPLPVDPELRVGTLENGLRYYVRANGRPAQRAELRLVVNAGSVLEDADQRGLAHFVEHMAFNGTRNFERQDLVDYLESIGMRFGPDLNAYTSFDETVYELLVPTDDADVLERAFDILEDWAWGVTFVPAEVEKERGVVIEEWRTGRGAGARILDQQLPVLFRGSRYAERLPIGRLETLQTFTHDALERFYQDWYRPDLMAVVAVGDFAPRDVERMIRERFGSVPMPAKPRARPVVVVPDHRGTVLALAADPEATHTQVSVLFKQPLRPRGTLDAYRQQLVERLYNRMLNARLHELTQKPDAPFLGAGSNQGRFVRSAEVYQLGAVVPEGGAAAGLEALLVEAERVRRHGFTQAELERHVAEMLRGVERAFAERDRTNSGQFAHQYVQAYLSGTPAPGIAWEFETQRGLLPRIRLAEVNRLAQAWITDDNRIVMASAPDKPGLQPLTEEVLLGAFAAARRQEITPYAEALADTPLIPQPPLAGRVVNRVQLDDPAVHDWRLSNGVRVLLLETDFKADEVRIHAFRPGGYWLAPVERHASAWLAAPAVGLGGLGAYSAVDLRKVTAGKVASVTPFIHEMQEGLTASGSPRDLVTIFELVHLTFTAPRADTAAFQAFLQMQQAFLENRGASPEGVFSDTLQATLAQYHPRAMPYTAATLEAVDLGDAYDFYRDRFGDAGGFTFVVVGNVGPDELEPLVASYLASLPATGSDHRWRDPGIRPPTGVVTKVVHKGREPKSRTQLVFSGPAEYTPGVRLALAALADLLRIRLREVLREDLGGTYGVAVSAGVSPEPEPRYRVGIGFGAAPERLEELVAVLFGELARVASDGPSDLDVRKVRESQRRAYETDLRENAFWIAALSHAARWDPAFEEVRMHGRRIETIDADLLRAAARLYLEPSSYVRVSLHPETGTAD